MIDRENVLRCSRCGQTVQLPGYEIHRKVCVPIVEHHRHFVNEDGIACRINSMTDGKEYGCEHPIYQGSIRNVWEKESVWHSYDEAARCILNIFQRKPVLEESVQVIAQ